MERVSFSQFVESSDALRANLMETAQEVVVRREYQLLLDIVADFRGIHNQLELLLTEVCHTYRNWELLLPQLRNFTLKNSNYYKRHPKGPEAFGIFSSIYLDALKESIRKEGLPSRLMESLFAWVDKFITLFSGEDLREYQTVLSGLFDDLISLGKAHDGLIIFMVQGRIPMQRVARRLLALQKEISPTLDHCSLARLMTFILDNNYRYWLEEEDPMLWFHAECRDLCHDIPTMELFEAISHEALVKYRTSLADIDPESNDNNDLNRLMDLPAHVDFVKVYKEISTRITRTKPAGSPCEEQSSHGEIVPDTTMVYEHQKLMFLFRIMDTSGLYLIHEETLRTINQGLVRLIRQQPFEDIEAFLLTTFQLLKVNVRKFPHTSLKCIEILGEEVFKRGNSRMVEAFLWEAVRFGFQHAGVTGIDEDWQPITNPAHLTNIRVWLHLITREPKWCATLFSALIIHLKLAGTCVKDTDLFQRDISHLLNHPIEPVYNLVKQFAKLMPVFYNEIGAEGELRYVSTELDEIHKRKDRLIHFLRKQSHVESSNLIVDFIQEIFIFWRTRDKARLEPILPQEVLEEVAVTGPFIDEQHLLVGRIQKEFKFNTVEDLLAWQKKDRKKYLDLQKDISPGERRRFDLMVQMYKLLHQKYNLSFQELRSELMDAQKEGFDGMSSLADTLENGNTEKSLKALLTCLEDLKEIILSSETFPAKEAIYHKRHIAVDIPSVYGRYQERKFDSLSLTFRMENLAGVLLEKLPATVNLSFITQATFFRIVSCLKLFMRALAVDGITSRRLDTYLSILQSSLKIRRFSYTQYLDIFRGLSEGVKDVIYAHYTNIHQNNLSIIIPQIGRDNLLGRYRSKWSDDDMVNTTHRLSEDFFRDLISSTFGLQHLDNFITRIIQTLERQRDVLDERLLDLLMSYNPEKTVSMLHDVNVHTHDLIHLSNKGYNLVTLTGLNLPVPPAFIITTEVFRCREVIHGFNKAKVEFIRRVRMALTRLEGLTGKVFGDPENPLLLSVRSGAALSMPGMMATIHNVGLNDELVEAYVKNHGHGYLAWDNYRRFVQAWAMISGVDREKFQELMDDAKKRHNVKFKWKFSPDQMRELALDYQKLARRQGISIPDDPWLQLSHAVEMIFDSWNTLKAVDYREIMDLSDSWGTAVIVQSMVFGNKSSQSGSGVLFTAHPYRKVRRVALWGDYAYGDQGEDIVAGLVTSYPISVEQAQIDGRSVEKSLEKSFPHIYNELLSIARDLVYEKRWNPQEMEFTFEGPRAADLYLLQTRDMITIKKQEQFDVFVHSDALNTEGLGKGIGVSGSALSGRVVFSEGNIKQLRREDPGMPLILIRPDTVPEDIKVIDKAEGLLTSRGGQTSHASVVAVRLEKTCVVGLRDLKVHESRQYCEIMGHRIAFGDRLSIDGRSGLVLLGHHPTQTEKHILPL
ncbi:pyruvate phosphate dikinase [Desulfocicer vacuolatum DSM 3385]|uniref:Pyruvate phosphate dikinase n=1 Tax=Desulfocicer vacuolatum DSM 3385 TaxID=1121400 RepID=A0A1W2CQF2_9BACT|nr:PEP/pyruvate-binding domain-containing protein [Desulfocicer vacuolatum]SMC87431.1 pyruvate phosphate dikinase [Desulfocicer vacuolatum DSM 3385]